MANPSQTVTQTWSRRSRLTPRDLNKLQPTSIQMKMLEKFTDFEAIADGVFKCKDNDQFVVVKIVSIRSEQKRNGTQNSTQNEIMREVNLLKELNHPNIVRVVDVMSNEHDVFVVFEYLDITLHNFLTNPMMFLLSKLMKGFLFQIVNAVAYLHSRKILHRDLRPENILISFRTHTLKIAHFSSARPFGVHLESSSNSVGCPYYEAPELLLGSTEYSSANDIWSVGCIFAEMILLRPLFRGRSDLELLKKIFTLLGTPTEATWPGVTSLCGTIGQMGPAKKPKDMKLLFSELEPDGIDLLSKMLCLCPNGRISAADAVKHPYFQGL